jgi:formylglycine-generating enzyme required for sulfatase activity/serine/threonine protein kinase
VSDAQHAAALVGTVLSGRGTPERRYRIDSVIGPGERGAWVFRGHDATSGTAVAVRCPGVADDPRGLDYEKALDTFVHEASLLARACEASGDVEQLLAYGISETSSRARLPFCVFEWLEGKSLEQLIVERTGAPLSISEALAILEPAARGLAAAHGLGVAHRDVRPRNLWLTDDGDRIRMKVTQFVLASRIGDSDDAFAPHYGAPEHFKRTYGAIGPHTDVYGLALSLVELLSGRRALQGNDATELYLATSALARRPTPRARGVQVSDAVEAVLARALAVDPKRRWQNARELWDALVAAVPELTPMGPIVHPLSTGTGNASNEGAALAKSGVPSIWAARDQASAVVAPGDDLRRGDSAKLTSFAPSSPAPARRDDGGISTWVVVGALAIVAIVVIQARIGSSTARPAAAPHAVASAPPEAKASPARAGRRAVASAPTARADEPAGRLPPFLTDMVRVPAGTFTMGTDKEDRGDGPAHTVRITKAFYIDRTEVTAEMYSACVEEGSCTPNRVHPLTKAGEGDSVEAASGCNTGKDQPRHPINCVDRVQAERFCTYAQKRLPTEAEWEYAARGADGREYPWGDTPPTTCSMANLSGLTGDCRDRKGTGEVGKTAPGRSPFGALDMAGNVWEWVADGYEPYPTGERTDPRGALTAPSAKGVLRGGSWDQPPTSAKATYRFPLAADIGNIGTGFRCARDAQD